MALRLQSPSPANRATPSNASPQPRIGLLVRPAAASLATGSLAALATTHQPSPKFAGIQQGRLFMARCVFDAVKCQRLLDALAAYHAASDDTRQEAQAKPYHDWSSHGADAFRLLAVCRTGSSGTERPHPRRVPVPGYAWTVRGA